MSIVAVTGDACTTTTVALAASWPSNDDLVLIDADPGGGDIAAWFDMPVTPSLSTVVTRVLDGAWPDIERHTRIAPNGTRVLPAPAGAGEATQALGESGRAVVPTLAARRHPIALADCGRFDPAGSNPFLAAAGVTVLVHRQAPQSARAAAVRLQRLVEQLDRFVGSTSGLVVAVVGAEPFGIDEIARFVADGAGSTPIVGLPVDDLAAAVLAGRTGVSERRLARLPLLRAARDLAATTAHALEANPSSLWRSAR